MEGCIFCDIVAGNVKTYKVYEDGLVLCVLDIHPVSMGHCLLMPKKHYKDMFDMDEDTYYATMDAIKLVSKMIRKSLNAKGMNIIHSSGREGQDEFHFHIHLIPRFEGDSLNIAMKSSYREKDLEAIMNRMKS